MLVPAPHPVQVRSANIAELHLLRLPVPPVGFPLVWEAGDQVALRSREEIEARAAILHVLLARCFGMPSEAAMQWLLAGRLVERLTRPEWSFVAAGQGDHRTFALHLEALYALAWLLGLTAGLDPTEPSVDGLARLFPDLRTGEPYRDWQARTLTPMRAPAEAAAALDRYYCLDWAYLEAERRGTPLPGLIDSNAIGQRRWALEWSVVFAGPYHDPPVGWEDVDLGG